MKIKVVGEGGHYLMGPLTVDEYHYWNQNSDKVKEHNWEDLAELANIFGPDGEKTKLLIIDDNDKIIEEKQMSELLVDENPDWSNTIKSVDYCRLRHGGLCNSDEVENHNEIPPFAFSILKKAIGTFAEFEVESFDVKLLELQYVVVEDAEIFTSIKYNNALGQRELIVEDALLETVEIYND